ncbi:transmembrane transport protein [Microbacterium esteraromaticum]|uniref:Transmembrane transport protein n=1 Tax=Microbacterium esteraromaticum TaxID=57043 RepID=A0A1R4J2U1_9MICO|nr:DUF2975 domain-containing protein [Microbacterium esteraromaticum]SJN26065.1 transmembrane transport protein [Microbacterium esteraromaticum]
MQPLATVLLRGLIAVLIALLLFVQLIMIPAVAAETSRRNPDLAYLEVPGIIGAVLFLVLVEVVLVCVFVLLSLVRADRIFSSQAFRYVDVIIGTMLASAVLLVASFIVLATGRAVNPGILVLAVFGVVVSLSLALLVGVMRGLLRKALELEQDLSEVV